MPARLPAPTRPVIAALTAAAAVIAAMTGSAFAKDDVTYRRVVVAPETRALVIDLPVAEDQAYVAGTASHPEHLLFSLDGGRRFAPLAKLRVIDGQGPRPATAADVTTLRWQVPAARGQRVEVSYRAVAR